MPDNSSKTLLDFYLECGFSAHFLVLSVLVFVVLAIFTCARRPSIYIILSLLVYSFIPLTIGFWGCAANFQTLFWHLQLSEHSRWEIGAIECLHPLLVGSFLSALFLFLTPIIWLFSLKLRAEGDNTAQPPVP